MLGGNLRECSVVAINTGHAISLSDHNRILDVTATGSPVTISTPSLLDNGFVAVVRRNPASDSNVIVDSLATLTVAGESVYLYCSGSEWLSVTTGSTGASGYSGTSGYSSYSGYSGFSGLSGFSSLSGYSGSSGTEGVSGFSGLEGRSGYSGPSGYSGISDSGYSGISGYSGFSAEGQSGYSGTSGYSGLSGIGNSGYSGQSGYSGVSSYSGQSGFSGSGGFTIPGTPDTGDMIFYYAPSGAWINLQNGPLAAGYLLTSNGNTDSPYWQDFSPYDSTASDVSLVNGWAGDVHDYARGNHTHLISIPAESPVGDNAEIVCFYDGEEPFLARHTLTDMSSKFVSGFSGYSGAVGVSGYSGIATSGYSGNSTSGFSGYSGNSTSGYSGVSAYSGASGFSGGGGGTADASGTMKMTACAAAPEGWLLCDGSAVSRTTYGDLFSAIATTYGAGNGTTTFNVPDFRGRSPMGVGTGTGGGAAGTGLPAGGSALTAVSRGSWWGAETHTLTTAQLAAHTHTTMTMSWGCTWASNNQRAGYAGYENSNNTGSAGSGSAHNNLAPRMGVNFIIKT